MNAAQFRSDLVKIMPGYSWTVHRSSAVATSMTATGVQSSGFNRLSTLQVTWSEYDKEWRGPTYEAKSAGHGTKSPWRHANKDRTLARALRGLQDHYEYMASTYLSLAARLKDGRKVSDPPVSGGAA